MTKEILDFYNQKLERKASLLNKLQIKENDLSYDMSINETINLMVLQAEVRLLKEVIEDFS